MNKLLRKENEKFLYYSFDEEEKEALLAEMSAVLIDAGFMRAINQRSSSVNESFRRAFPRKDSALRSLIQIRTM